MEYQLKFTFNPIKEKAKLLGIFRQNCETIHLYQNLNDTIIEIYEFKSETFVTIILTEKKGFYPMSICVYGKSESIKFQIEKLIQTNFQEYLN